MSHTETIFLTGFPGFIAGRFVERLAKDNVDFLLLVQPALTERAKADVRRIIREAQADESRFRILEGDITRANLGLSDEDLVRAQRETTILFHLAAVYDLAVAREFAMRVNVEGTRNVNEFAKTLANLRHYHYVSTCYVAGKRTGVIYEKELRHEAGFRNYYEETKYLAELEVENLKAQLPVTIHRPSVVCGDSQTGETAKYDGIYYLIKYLMMQPDLLSLVNIGNHAVRLNIVPVDFVVEAMAALLCDARAANATVQLADPSPLTTYQLFEEIARSLAGRGSRLSVPPKLVRSTLGIPMSEVITGMPRVAVPYFFIEQAYDTTQAQKLLEPHGVRCPAFSSYVDALTKYAGQHPKL
ncbi:MAG: SDR family oxidoreductase [Pyrinomonadaceae bacterium]|nr:SDR family oxidoreductase [Pyrinomonadaceae bacterium]